MISRFDDCSLISLEIAATGIQNSPSISRVWEERGGQTLFLDSGHSQFGSGAESDIERWWKIGNIFLFLDIIFALFVGQVNATSTPFYQRDTRIKQNLIN